jgi:cobaltochelatase CobN
VRVRLPLARYEAWFATLPPVVRERVIDRWGAPSADPRLEGDAFALALLALGQVVLGIQPARGYQIDPAATYHSPDLVPPHGYLAFYFHLREVLGVHAVVHLGKHGNLEWLPGKALALSDACLPEVALGPLPHLYPFIVNDPGEGTQAKRRAAGVIIDHLTPPLTRAEGHGELREIEGLLDEYHLAAELDPRRAEYLEREIVAASARLGLLADLDLLEADRSERLRRLDGHLCELKELQIRDGLHVLGRSPEGSQQVDLLVALARAPRGRGDGGSASLVRALASDLGLGDWDPLGPDLAQPWTGTRPLRLERMSLELWRTAGDTVERLEQLARRLIAGDEARDESWSATSAVLNEVEGRLRPALARCGPAEIANLLRGLDGRFVPPGPSGAPTRGRPDVLPTGRNFYAVDTRAVPTPAAWALGWRSAAMIVERYLQEHGDWPRHVALSAWGTACMRTGGEDLAQALALMGCRPTWDGISGRVTGVEVLPLAVLDRPRVDVTLRISGLFRDAFPAQIELLDDAVRAVAGLDEPEALNPLRSAARDETSRLVASGLGEAEAWRRATLRVFGSKPGAYGAGLQVPIDEGAWSTAGDLAETFLAWSGFAYGRGIEGDDAEGPLRQRLAGTELVLHNQDNREHDLLDSDDYYQFEGGLIAAVRTLSGRQPEAFHNDHSRPDHPRVRRLKEEIGLVVRGRAANPKWIAGVMRHGYKGAFEIAATVDYLFAFAATAQVVSDQHFDALFDAYLGDEKVRAFMARHNPAALVEVADRFAEAVRRELWQPSRNSALPLLDELRGRTPAEAG